MQTVSKCNKEKGLMKKLSSTLSREFLHHIQT